MNFAELHNQHEPLLIANVWDAASAVAAQEAGYQALGTSSAAIASTLGYESVQQDIQPGVDLMRSPTGAGAVYHKLGKHPPAHHPGRNAIR